MQVGWVHEPGAADHRSDVLATGDAVMTGQERRARAELLAREVRDLMDMGVPKHLPFETWMADYFMRFYEEVTER